MPSRERPPRVLSIAGSDSGGGAGIQADLRAFAACGVHGMTALTAVTAQNTVGVRAIHHIPPDVILAQVVSVVEDIGVDALKIGMLGTSDTIEAVRYALEQVPREVPIVIDPVMVTTSGSVLLEQPAQEALVTRLLPRATVVTPNVPEARVIAAIRAGRGSELAPDGDDATTAVALARSLLRSGPRAVVVTGGHRRSATDVYVDADQVVELPGERYPDGAAHGSGCTHSSILAARLAWGDDPLSAARAAKAMAARAVAQGLRGIGRGPGPVDVLGLQALTGSP